MDFLTINKKLAADIGSIAFSENTHGQFRPACAHQSGDAHHFTSAHVHADIVNNFAFRIKGVIYVPVFHFHQYIPDSYVFASGETVCQVTAYHAFDNTVFRNIIGLFIHRLNGGAVTDNGNFICYIRNLI